MFLLAEYSEQYERAKLEGDEETMTEYWRKADKLSPITPNATRFDLSKLKYATVELTEIVRQGKDNPIIELSYGLQYTLSQLLSKEDNVAEKTKIVRKDLTEEELQAKVQELIDNPYTFIDDSNEPEKTYIEQEVVYQGGYLYTNDRNKIIERLAETNGTNELKYLAWTNVEVDKVNEDVRKKIYGNDVRKVEQDEILVLNAPYGEFHTNEEVKINEVHIANYNFIIPNENSDFSHTDGIITLNQKILKNHKGEEIKDVNGKPMANYDSVTLKVYRIFASSVNRKDNEQINGYMTIVHEDSQQEWNKLAKQVEYHCRGGVLSYEAKPYLNEQVADFKYNHAISTHRSQGSTYTKVIINVGNINMNKNLAEKKRLLYTAITRASELIILYNVK